jgi:hypothetical protein
MMSEREMVISDQARNSCRACTGRSKLLRQEMQGGCGCCAGSVRRLPAIRHCKIGGERGAGAHGAVRVYVYVSGNAAAEGDAGDVVKYWKRRAPQKEEKDCLPVHTSAAP